jgi:hypothetical protein
MIHEITLSPKFLNKRLCAYIDAEAMVITFFLKKRCYSLLNITDTKIVLCLLQSLNTGVFAYSHVIGVYFSFLGQIPA